MTKFRKLLTIYRCIPNPFCGPLKFLGSKRIGRMFFCQKNFACVALFCDWKFGLLVLLLPYLLSNCCFVFCSFVGLNVGILLNVFKQFLKSCFSEKNVFLTVWLCLETTTTFADDVDTVHDQKRLGNTVLDASLSFHLFYTLGIWLKYLKGNWTLKGVLFQPDYNLCQFCMLSLWAFSGCGCGC